MSKFAGFESPGTTPVPDVIFDELLGKLTGNELKALLYIIRRTYGFQKNADAISLSQFREGIITQEKKVLDRGCGIKHNRTILAALTSLEAKGYIISRKRTTNAGDADTTIYKLHFKSAFNVQLPEEVVTSGNYVVTPGNDGSYPRSPRSLPQVTTVVTPGNPQETVLQETVKQQTELQEGTFVADATPAPLQENVFADDDPEKTVERLPAVHIETASHIATHDYANEGGEHAHHDYCSEQRPGVSVFLPALAGSGVPPDMHDTPDADQGHPGLSAGLHAASSRDRTDAQTPGDQAVTPSQQTRPDVLAGAAPGDGQALDAAAIAPPGHAPSASGGKGTGNGKALLCEPAKVRAALLAFRGYALESAGALINENKAIKAWCALHSEGELALVMEALEQDRYWGKVENREHFTVANFATETPKMLARLKRRGEPRVLDDGATSEWDFANYIGNGPEDMAAWMRRAEAQEAQGLLNF